MFATADRIPVHTRDSISNLRTFEGFEDNCREHVENISTVTLCNENNKEFVSNLGPSSFPMFVTF